MPRSTGDGCPNVRAAGRIAGMRRISTRWRWTPTWTGGLVRLLAGTALAAILLTACENRPWRPNVVLITIDTLRADSLGIYGNPGGHSPHIDALAREATVFENAVTPIGTTFPSHASMFTGFYPKHHGVRWNGDALDDDFSTLAEILSAQEYETAAFVSFGKMLTHGGLHQGFAVRSDAPETEPSFMTRDGDEVNTLAKRWLAERSERPFFLWLHYAEPHSPYRVTPYAREQFLSAGYSGALAEGATAQDLRALGDTIPWSPAERGSLRALYDGEVREADRLLGEMVAELKERSLLEKSLVIFAADHGQALGEHDDVGHGFLLWQPVLHVPLVIRDPRSTTPRRISQRVSLVDLTPTILDLLGIEGPAAVDGRPLTPALGGRKVPPRPLFAEVRDLGKNPFRTIEDTKQVAVLDGRVKAIWTGKELTVFDLERDPEELKPVPASEMAKATEAELAELLSTYFQSAVDPAQRDLNESMVEELRALGYIR